MEPNYAGIKVHARKTHLEGTQCVLLWHIGALIKTKQKPQTSLKSGHFPCLELFRFVNTLGISDLEFRALLWLQVVLSLVGKFGAAASFAIVFVYTAELFPTEIRSTAVGGSSFCGRIGGIIAPQIALLDTVWTPFPLLIMGTGSLIGGILVFVFLPETLGKKLPSSMQEALNL